MPWIIEPELRFRVRMDYSDGYDLAIYAKSDDGVEHGLSVPIADKTSLESLISKLRTYADTPPGRFGAFKL